MLYDTGTCAGVCEIVFIGANLSEPRLIVTMHEKINCTCVVIHHPYVHHACALDIIQMLQRY